MGFEAFYQTGPTQSIRRSKVDLNLFREMTISIQYPWTVEVGTLPLRSKRLSWQH